MKKINLVSGFGAKFAVAAFAVAGLTLTSCEKEDFEVNVPNISVIVPSLPEAEPGVAYLILSATSASGNDLDGVVFTSNGAEMPLSTAYSSAATVTVTASKEGYNPVVKTITIPQPAEGSYTTYPLNFVLSAIEGDYTPDVPGTGLDTPEETWTDNVPVETTITNGALLTEGTHTTNVSVPVGEKYTTEQITALYEAVNQLEGPDTRALDAEGLANLQKAKELLRTKIAGLRTEWATEPHSVTYKIEGGNAVSLTMEVTTTQGIGDVTLTVHVAANDYSVKGKCTMVVSNSIKVIDAKGEDISHSHDHGHGGNGNSGGGTGNGQA